MKKLIIVLMLCLSSTAFAGFFEGKEDWLRQSIAYAAEANQISAALPEIQNSKGAGAAEEKQKEIVSLMRKSIDKADKLNTEFLQSIHPDLPRFYIEFLIGGQRDYLSAMKSGDTSAQVKAIRKMAYWGRFWDRYKTVILPKLET